jgi:hypothetical protein
MTPSGQHIIVAKDYGSLQDTRSTDYGVTWANMGTFTASVGGGYSGYHMGGNGSTIVKSNYQPADVSISTNGGTSFSLVARWVPREKSKKFGWLYYYLATNYSQHQIPSDSSHPSYERAVNRAFMIYRKVISAINKKLDTTQIKQCDGKWSEINFDNVTSITMHKQTNSFLNLNKNGKTTRCENDEDRDNCKDNYEAYLRDVVGGSNKIKGKRVSIIDFVKSARNIIHEFKDLIVSNSMSL